MQRIANNLVVVPKVDAFQISSSLTESSPLRCSSSFASTVPKKEWSTPIKEGDLIPNVTFKTRTISTGFSKDTFEWKDLSCDDLFKDRRIVLFALPGAFTPTCSASHLPGYNNSYDAIRERGIDDVYCLSVNDAFVMRQWGLKHG